MSTSTFLPHFKKYVEMRFYRLARIPETGQLHNTPIIFEYFAFMERMLFI